MNSVYDKISEAQQQNIDVVLCTLVSTRGSTPRKIGAKMLVYADGGIYGTLGGGEFERVVIQNALESFKTKTPQLFRHDLLHQHGMCCGGTMEVYIEPIMKKNKLYVFGAGHTGLALAKYASDFHFETIVIDDRKEYLDKCLIENVNKMNLPPEKALPILPFDENTFICIMTYSHPMDRDILAFCIKKSNAYLGMIGSKRKIELTRKMFMDLGLCTLEELNRVDMPMGIDISAEGPEEIAISILSKIIAVKHKKQDKKVPRTALSDNLI